MALAHARELSSLLLPSREALSADLSWLSDDAGEDGGALADGNESKSVVLAVC